MFISGDCKHPHFESACSRFKSNHVISQIAPSAGIDAQVLRNKLGPDQPHQLTVVDLIALYHATDGDETLIDGMLLECGLTAIAIPSAERAPSLPHQAIDLNAKVASIGQRALELSERGRVSRTERNTIVSVATSAMGSLALLIHDIEARFQAVPTVACASDILMQTMTM
ncbi:TPA: phage regulatory CII family protein [Aeromonas veronii]|uniref:phage regulatory CII family protein n=1 Tax=Aeromonas veronii TaxID=654 RepID=UPI00037C6F8B|nr:phage regulatory CII family protein [Aeromonas veronii]HDO1329772.1 phage regulatory CII family protein [Aeromonas veronii]HDO1335423.1 phage regulatory CII family protein [Aeromonas veronii]HDO1339852.1 phage regulatory CII family protein [Aeromonas veronii]HDO1344293.1 phage regulatory CII family protein [Aeromonas veronii]HDO1348883.1 phage regulatory CII family protein [Aeromonas veronii]